MTEWSYTVGRDGLWRATAPGFPTFTSSVDWEPLLELAKAAGEAGRYDLWASVFEYEMEMDKER